MRQEKKYLLKADACEKLFSLLGDALRMDERGRTRISNLYLDTPDHLLIRRSVEKPDFKEKLRVRTYGTVCDEDHSAFLEIKRKCLGTVYKRRVRMTLREARGLVEAGAIPRSPYQGDAARVALNRQIMRELQWALTHYGALAPTLAVGYERCAYTYRADDGSLRLTLDRDLRWCEAAWERDGYDGRGCQLLSSGACLMELKASAPLPPSLTHALDQLELYPRSFSKVGRSYEALMALTGERAGRQARKGNREGMDR
jgi:hypothetical protein